MEHRGICVSVPAVKYCAEANSQMKTSLLRLLKTVTPLTNGFLLAALLCMFASTGQAQQPVCNGGEPTCVPDSGWSGYSGAAAASAKTRNARGYSNPTVAKVPLQASTAGAAASTETVVGSQSYNYTIPILRLAGRAGMDLALNLYYNSRLWDVDTVNGTATFNMGRDFPSYGFRLDFGYIESSGDGWFLTQSDGTKQALAQVATFLYDSTDGNFIEFNIQTKFLDIRTVCRSNTPQFRPAPPYFARPRSRMPMGILFLSRMSAGTTSSLIKSQTPWAGSSRSITCRMDQADCKILNRAFTHLAARLTLHSHGATFMAIPNYGTNFPA
jgi:hypothetical protein